MRYRMFAFAPFVFAALCGGCGGNDGSSSAPTRYAITRLATTQSVQLFSLNDNGQYVGNTFQPPLPTDSVVLNGGTLQTLEPQRQYLGSNAYAINNLGQAAGTREVGTDVSGGGVGNKACFYSNGAVQTIDAGGSTQSYAYAVNDAGQVTGVADVPGSNSDGIYRTNAFLWQDGALTLLGTLGGPESGGSDINQSGQIVGYSDVDARVIHAFIWQSGKMTDLSGGAANAIIGSEAFAINNHGQIVGTMNGHAALWQNGTMQDLGHLPGDTRCRAISINEAGEIIGVSIIDGGGPIIGSKTAGKSVARAAASLSTPVVFRNGSVIKLSDLLPANSGWTIDGVYKINNHGQILASGIYQGEQASALLTPQ